jgi:hypothetical protein
MTTQVHEGELPLATKDALRAPARQAFEILHWGFVVAPVAAGLDKFFDVLTRWETYLAPPLAHLSPFSAHTTMMVIGVVEMVAGLIVAVRPKVGGWVVAGWLGAIIVNLVIQGHSWDIALRDLGLLLAAIALARLAVAHERRDIA